MNRGKVVASGNKIKEAVFKSSGWSWKLIKDSLNLRPNISKKVELIRSLYVSVIALIVDASILIFCKEIIGIHYLVAAGLGFIGGVVVNYILSVTWVFSKRKLDSKHIEFVIFVVICAVGLALNLIIIAALVEWFNFDYRVAKVVAVVIIFFWNFLMRKKLLY